MGCKPEELLDPQHPLEGVEGPYTIAGGSIFGFPNDYLLLRRPQVTGAGKLYISFMSLSSLIGRDNSDFGYFLQPDHRGVHNDE